MMVFGEVEKVFRENEMKLREQKWATGRTFIEHTVFCGTMFKKEFRH